MGQDDPYGIESMNNDLEQAGLSLLIADKESSMGGDNSHCC